MKSVGELIEDLEAENAKLKKAASRQSRSKVLLASNFNDWWAKNHPLDWWASVPHRKGQPMNHGDRLLVRALCQRAYEANRD